MKKKKSPLLLLIIILIVVALAFVAYKFIFGKQLLADSNGNPIIYKWSEIEKDELTGIFVKNENGTFSPTIQDLPGFQGETEEANPIRYVWYPVNDSDITDYIPTLKGNAKLVAVYNTDKEIPSSLYLEKYTCKGYTIGAHINIAEDKTLYLMKDDALTGSNAKSKLSELSDSSDQYTISEISGSKVLPIDNVDPNMSVLLGLEKNKLYTIKYYQGTFEQEITFKADAKIFQSSKYIKLSSPYKKTGKGYFVINLPSNLANGYYYISTLGFFKYEK